jgi:oxalate decarboxylase/phosphoglucose isomerase-like protein (cupin superfamily)
MTDQTPIIDRAKLPTSSFDWGVLKWLVTPEITPGAGMTVGEVVLMPGMAHERHNHPESEEILYFLTGVGEQMLDDGKPFTVRGGDVVYVPTAIFHSTINTGWEPLRLLVVYNPGGPEAVLRTLGGYRETPAGQLLFWERGTER